MEGTKWRIPERAWLYGAPLAATAIHAAILAPRFVDDAFITFRFSANIASGAGPVFTQGSRIEGYSNLLWTFLLAVPAKLGISLPWAAITLGVACLFASTWLVVRIALVVEAPKLLACAAGVLVGASTAIVGSSMTGLETPLFMLGLLLALWAAVTASSWQLALAVVIVGLTRAEGVVLALAIAIVALALSRLRREGRPIAAPPVAGALVVLGAVKLWERHYYGHWLPMSVLAKRDNDVGIVASLHRSFRPGVHYLLSSLGVLWLVLAALTIGAALLTLRAWRSSEIRLVVAAAVMVSFGALVAAGNKGDWMPFGRLIAPYVPVALVALAALFGVVVRERSPRRSAASGLMVAWAVLAIAAQPLPPSWRSYPREFRYPVEEAIGHAFRDGRAPGDLMGTPILGALGYYARPARVEDEYGLIEPEVALSHRRAYPFGKYLPGYLIGLHPSMLVYDSWMDLGRAVSEGSDSYTAFVGDQMNRAGIFVAVRSDTVGRFGPLLASRLGARPVPLDTALAEWRLAYPRFA